MFTHYPAPYSRESKEKKGKLADLSFFFLPGKKRCTLPVHLWISHQAPQLLASTTVLKFCESHNKQKFYHLNS